jgi:hypothetical protein
MRTLSYRRNGQMERTMTTTTTDTDQHAILRTIDRHLATATNAVQRAMGPAGAYDTDPGIYDRVAAIWEALRALEDALAAQS